MAGEIRPDSIEFEAGVAVEIATGVLTITQSVIIVQAQTGTTDDLDTITLGTNFDTTRHQLIFLIADTGDTITVKHGTGNITLNGAADFSLTANKFLALLRDTVTGDFHDLN